MKTNLFKTNHSILILGILLIPTFLLAAVGKETGQTLNPVNIMMGILGGLALFLYGMELMSDGLKQAAGEKMKLILAALSKNRFLGVITGTITTAIIQSSSVTTVLLVGFVSAGLMSLSQSVSIIFGANIGTTITAQIIAFKVTKYALLMIAIGFGMLFFSKKEAVKQYGSILLGLGLVFYGMSVMSSTMKPMRSNEDFINLMAGMSNPLFGILTAAVFTALVQSSSATTGVVIVLAMQGIITLEAGIALSLGANIGTCITAGVASIGKRREAVRVAMVHVIFNTVGVLLILPFISYFAELARDVSPVAGDALSVQDARASTVPRQIANAHTIFNLGMAVIFLPFTTQIASLLYWLLPEKKENVDEDKVETRYVEESLLPTPELALTAVKQESMRMGNWLERMITKILPVLQHGKDTDLEELKKNNDKINALQGLLLQYLRKLSNGKFNEDQGQQMMDIISTINHLENMGEIIETEVVVLAQKRKQSGVVIPDDSVKDLEAIINKTSKAFSNSMKALERKDHSLAKSVVKMKNELDEIAESKKQQQAQILLSDDSAVLEAYRVEIALVDILKRIYYHTKRIARRI